MVERCLFLNKKIERCGFGQSDILRTSFGKRRCGGVCRSALAGTGLDACIARGGASTRDSDMWAPILAGQL